MSGDRPHILVIEDNDDFAHLLTGMLEQEYSAEVDTAGTLDQGRVLLGSGRWDLVSLDYGVGDEDGLVLLREIASSGDGPPVILVTGQGQERLAAQSVELGARGYVIKDLKMRETFLASVGRVLAEEAQRRAERSLLEQADELRASEERYRILTSNMSDVIWTTDLELNFTYLSPPVFGQTGYTAEEVMSLGLDGIITPESKEVVIRRFATEMARAAETDLDPPVPTVFEIEQYRQDGTTFPVEVSVGFLREPDGTPYGILGVTRDITERKKAQEKLRLTQFTVDHAADSVLWTTLEGEIIYANEEACRRRGYTLEEMLSLRVTDINADMQADRGLWEATVEQMEKYGHFTREFRHRTKAGEVFPVEATVNRFDFEGREIFVAHLRDITERKRDEEEIRALNRRLEGILASVADGILTLGVDRMIASANPAAERITGYSSGELVGNSTRMLYASDADYEEAGGRLYPQVLEKGNATGEIRARRADGAVVPVELSMALMEEEGEPAGVVIAFRDISERRAAEEEIASLTRRLEKVLSSVNEGIITLDLDRTINSVNRAAAEMLGYREDELVGRDVKILYYSDDEYETVGKRYPEVIRNGYAATEISLQRRDGTVFPVEASLSPMLEDGHPTGMVAVFRDRSDRKQAERLASLQRDLAVTAAETADPVRVIRAAVEAVPGLTGLDAAGIYLADERTGDIELVYSVGLSDRFVEQASRFPAGSRHAQLVNEGTVMFLAPERLGEMAPANVEECLKAGAVLPLRTAEGVLGCLNVASHDAETISSQTQDLLETLAGQVAQAIARARLAAAVRESEAKFRLIYDNAGEAIYSYGLDLVLTDVNPRACELIGYSWDEMVGRNVLETGTLHPDDVQRTADNISNILSGRERIVTDEYRLITRDGRVLDVEVTGAAVFDGSGDLLGVTNIAADITEQKRARRELEARERSLRESERRYREMLETVHLGAVLLDTEGRITFINEYMTGMSGWTREEALGRNWFETFIPPEARELVAQYFRDSIENGNFEPATGENEIVTRTGERRVIRWYNTILRDEAGEASGVASLGEDVTRRRVALQALATSREQLRALSRHLTVVREDERADLARELHDELGQSLTGLKMDTVWLERNLMEEKPDLTQVTERLRSMADMIDSNIGVVRRIASGLRLGILDDLGLVPALEWTVEDFSFRTGIAAECHSELGDVDLDQFTRTQVFRIVQEALTNVARHSGARHVKVRVGRDDVRLTVEVADDGVGISSEAVAGRDSLGIVGMHERARLIGGELKVSGEREEGTSVVLKVPSFEDGGGPD
ncbi:MAG: PAS domain S-box protein [Actinobacteria bacterium]|nr:PAS domain S-box protein [Actinomycetota bacterium]MBU1943423.1 PAS domain S-box protein [Actinomycetota bacterium]MBU2686780.1 PAS domain S-box protein [Actinomycetota bacterium]